jgi:ubiquinone biosynthesis protein
LPLGTQRNAKPQAACREGKGALAMIPEGFHIDPQELSAIVPDCYAEFRPIVADGLTFFLRQHSPGRQAEIFQAQTALPADAGLLRRLVLLLRACPALHKLAQVIARDRHLDLELRRHLQELESLEPHTPVEQWRPALARELAPAAEEYRICVDENPLAEGSVAVVVPLTWSDPVDGPRPPRRQAVAKLLKPGIAQRLDEDLRILGRLADHLDEHWAAYGLPPLAYRETLDEVAELLTDEVQLRLEQAHLRRAASQFAGQSDLRVPRVLPFCTDAVTAMERVDGRKVADPQALPAWRRPAMFLSIVRGLLSQVLFSRDESVLFHGDPHAGNLLATHDGRLAILDWSLAGQLTTDDRVQTSQLLLGAWARDGRRITSAIATLAANPTEADLVRRHVEAALAEVRWGKPPGPTWAMDLLGTLARAGVRFPPRLLLFRKALLTLQGVLSDVCPAASLEAALMAEALMRFAWEWPLRWWKPFDDRNYATHVSSADLASVALRRLAVGTS